MNFLSKVGISSLLLASNVALAVEPPLGWYAGLFVGPTMAPSTDFGIAEPTFFNQSSFTTPLLSPFYAAAITEFNGFHRVNYNIGVNGGGQLGYRCNKFRYEGELMFNTNTFNKVQGTVFSLTNNGNNPFYVKGSTSFFAGLFNVFYEFYDEEDADTRFVPYIGLGLGYASINNRLNLYYNNRAFNRRYVFPAVDCNLTPLGCNSIKIAKAADTAGAAIGQAIAGISYFYSDALSFGSDLRYMSTKNISEFGARASVISWNFLMNYAFDDPYY